MKIDWVEIVKTASGKEYKKTTINGESVSVWPDFPLYAEVQAGREVEGVIRTSGKYKNLVSALQPPKFIQGARTEQIKEAQQRKEHSIEQAQDRSAWMWAKNNAVTLIANNDNYKNLTKDELVGLVNEMATEIFNLEPTKPF